MRFTSVCLFVIFSSSLSFAAEHSISQKGKTFSQAELNVAVGDAVKFSNDDDTSHNVFSSTSGLDFNLGIQKAGAVNSKTFDKAGTVEVRCAIHPQMKLKVNVK